jgi:hypothetical protein
MHILSLVHLGSGTDLQVTSRNAGCERAVSVYSSDNIRLQVESNTDTCFAVTSRPEGAQLRRFEQSRRGGREGCSDSRFGVTTGVLLRSVGLGCGSLIITSLVL